MANWRTRASWALWHRGCQKGVRHFEAALKDPAKAQKAQLKSILAHAEGSQWAQEKKIDSSASVHRFQERVPIEEPHALQAWTERILRGEPSVLTRTKVDRLVPTSGTTGHHKLIPMNRESRREFSTAVNLWLYDCLERAPPIRRGRAYIATSPAIDFQATQGAVAVGFASDSAYLGTVERRILNQVLAVRTDVARLRGTEWREKTRELLTRADDLSFLSLWHPGYMEALFDETELRQLSARWKNLSFISCWSDGACESGARRLSDFFPKAQHQAKGLWLTEGAVTVPWLSRCPIALLSGFFEFETSDGSLHLAHKLEPGVSYRPILTNHAGLYRYRLGDLVRVSGYIERTPCLTWVGRADYVSDLCGEKLSDAQVASALQEIGWQPPMQLTPQPKARPPYYICTIEEPIESFPIEAFERVLRKNPHYKWAIEVGQLSAIQVKRSATRKLEDIASDSHPHAKGSYLSVCPNDSPA